MTVKDLRDEFEEYDGYDREYTTLEWWQHYCTWVEKKLIQTLKKPCPDCDEGRNLIHKADWIDMGKYTHVDTDSWEKIQKWVYGTLRK